MAMEHDLIPGGVEDGFCASLLSRYSSSTQEEDMHVCTVIVLLSQELKKKNHPLTPISYFGITCSTMEDALSGGAPPHMIKAHFAILSQVLPLVPHLTLKRKREYLSQLLLRGLRSIALSTTGVATGLKCISRVLMASDETSWSDATELYSLLISFVDDSRSKVRRQSHVCISQILQAFQGTPMLAPASVGVTKIFERVLLLAGGSDASAALGPKGALEVLFVLDALKECISLMPMGSTTIILKYLKTPLLELRQQLVTKRIKDILSTLCLHQASEFSPALLLDLLCFIAQSASSSETLADAMTSSARLLDVGMRKVYSLDRQACVVKLPLVFNALKEIMAYDHMEAVFAVTEALNNLIKGCIDEDMIKQGVEQIMENGDSSTRRSRPTIIEKICANIDSLLDYRFAAVWDMSFRVISTLFDKLGEHSTHLLRGTLKSLGDMQKLVQEDFPYRKQLHECVGSGLGAMGPESFFSILPLELDLQDLPEVNVWLCSILKRYTVGARLGFFQKSILEWVREIRRKSRVLELKGHIYSSRTTAALAHSLWSLLPSFCNFPKDTAESFGELKNILCTALKKEPDLVGIICSSLQTLVRQNKSILDGTYDLADVEVPKQRAMAHYTPRVVAHNINVLKSSAYEILSNLSETFLNSRKDPGKELLATIREFLSISDKAIIARFFIITRNKLLKVTPEAGNAGHSKIAGSMEIENSSSEVSTAIARARLLDLASSLLPGLDAKETDLLYSDIKAALEESIEENERRALKVAHRLIKKKAYKVLSVILRSSDGFSRTKQDELVKLMSSKKDSLHCSGKRYRLECFFYLILHVTKDESEQKWYDVTTSFVAESILGLKEVDKGTRNRAYDMLVRIGHVFADEKGGKTETLHQYFTMVAGGLKDDKPQTISAAVRGLARLVYEFTDLLSEAYDVLPSMFLLILRTKMISGESIFLGPKNEEIINSTLGFVKVLVAKSQSEVLQKHLEGMVECLMKLQDDTTNHFKAKVKLLLEMLVKKCGPEAVEAVMPEAHMKLLKNIQRLIKTKEKKQRGSSKESRSVQSKATTSRLSRWNHTKIFSDDNGKTDGSDADYLSGRTMSSRWTSQFNSKASPLRRKGMRKATKSLPEDMFEELQNEPLDLLDRKKTISALRPCQQLKRKPESDDELEMDTEGRLVIREGAKSKRQLPSEAGSETRSSVGSHISVNSSMKNRKRQKVSGSRWAYTGGEYANKKAGGDLKKKGKLEPYAYWPLDRKMMSRRREHRAAARRGMAGVVKLTKKFEGKFKRIEFQKERQGYKETMTRSCV